MISSAMSNANAPTSPRITRARRAIPRVLFLEPNDDGTVGGSHQVLFDFARHLDRRRYVPVAVFYQDNVFVEKLRDEGVEVHVLTAEWAREKRAMRTGRRLLQGRMFLEAVARRVRFLRRHEIAILHVNGTPQTGHDDWLPAAFLLGLPAVANCAGNVQFGVRSFLQRAFMRGFDRVLPVSHHIGQQVIDFGYNPNRVTTIHPGIDIEKFRARVNRVPGELRSELGVAPNTMLIAMVGNLRPWKGQHVAIEALALLTAPERAAVQLLLIGGSTAADADYQRELLDRVEREGLHAQVRFLGHRSDAPDLMAAADVVLHASTEPEPFGLVLVEGMALGRPIIASSIGGPAEILDPETSLTFSPERPQDLARHISHLLSSPDYRRELGAAGKTRARKFEIATTVRATTQVYDQLLGHRESF